MDKPDSDTTMGHGATHAATCLAGYPSAGDVSAGTRSSDVVRTVFIDSAIVSVAVEGQVSRKGSSAAQATTDRMKRRTRGTRL